MKEKPMHLKAFTPNKSARLCGNIVFFLLVAILCTLYFEFTYELSQAVRTGISVGLFYGNVASDTIFRMGVFTLIAFFLLMLMANSRIAEAIVKYRYLLSAILLCVLVVFEISGSSVALWGSRLGENSFNGTLFGRPWSYRSDEWSVFTPFAFSQSYTGNHAISEVIRGCPTDVTMVYAQPSWSVATLFRPFLWGFLALGASRGLSFFWCARAIVLVLTTYECMLLITDRRRRIAAYGAILVGFAPIVEWWFAVNGTAELFIFGQGLVLSLHHMLRAHSFKSIFGWSALLSWLLGCYAMIIYPSWQIPLAYVFGFIGIADLCHWAKEVSPGKRLPVIRKLALPLTLCLVIVIVLLCISIANSWDAIQAVMHTHYPGSRSFTGGNLLPLLVNPFTSTLAPFWPKEYEPNVCEASAFVSLFPLGIILAICTLIYSLRKGHADTWVICLLVPYAILFSYGAFGFPSVLAKLTLLSNVQTGRLMLALGYLDVALLVRALTCAQDTSRSSFIHTQNPIIARACTVGIVSAIVIGAITIASIQKPRIMQQSQWTLILLGATTAVLATPIIMIFTHMRETSSSPNVLLLASAAVVLVAGMCVNPFQHGADALLKSETLNKVKQVVQEDPDAIWIADSSDYGQAIITVGARTISSVNVYPNLERWRSLDPEGAFIKTYNRYVHIQISPFETTTFTNPYADFLVVTVNPDELPKLGATYWLALGDIPQWNTEHTQFVPYTTAGPFTVYRIVSR